MNDQDKSLILLKAMEWEYRIGGINRDNNSVSDMPVWYSAVACEWSNYDWPDDESTHPNLYDPANMALAWRVLNWAMKQHDRMVLVVDDDGEVAVEQLKYWTYRLMNVLWETGKLPPADAQRLWLDKALELALESGLIEATT